MLNFYNYYDKIHPELMKKLKELETKITSGSADNNDTLIIRVGINEDKDENMFAKGDVIFTRFFGANDTIELSEEQALRILTDVKVIMIYYKYDCTVLYKTRSNAQVRNAYFGYESNGILVDNNILTRMLPS